MLQKYLENNIYRKVVLLEALYNNEKIDFQYYLEVFEVFPTTLQNDLEQLLTSLDTYILNHWKQKHYYFVEFDKNFSLFEIRKEIYQQSLFLKTISKYLENNFNYLDVVEEEFISVSKSYTLKNRCEAFFDECHLQCNHGRLNISEFETRLLYLYLITKIDFSYETVQPIEFEETSEKLLDLIERQFSKRVYSPESKNYILQGMNIAYSRQNKETITFEKEYIQDLKKRPIHEHVVHAWQELDMEIFLKEEEIIYVVSLFNNCDYHFEELESLFKDHEQLRSVFLGERPDVIRLIQCFEEEFDLILLGNKAFEAAIIKLTRNAKQNFQVLFHESFYTLHTNNIEVYERVIKTLNKWRGETGDQIILSTNLIYRFIYEVRHVLEQEKLRFYIKIVTDSDIKYLIYKNTLSRFSLFEMVIDDRLYQSIYDIEDYESTVHDEFIFCEESFLPPTLDYHPHIIPITVDMLLDHTFLLKCMEPYRHFIEYHNTEKANNVLH